MRLLQNRCAVLVELHGKRRLIVAVQRWLGRILDLDDELRAGSRRSVVGRCRGVARTRRRVEDDPEVEGGSALCAPSISSFTAPSTNVTGDKPRRAVQLQLPLDLVGHFVAPLRIDADVHVEVDEAARSGAAFVLDQLNLRRRDVGLASSPSSDAASSADSRTAAGPLHREKPKRR